MFKLERALKTYREAGALNAQVNLLGFIDDHTFLTKGGDVGVILAVSGIDYECLASAEVDSYTKRLELALKIFDEKCRVYQYLFKRNHETIPYQTYQNRVVNSAIESRVAFLKSKAESLYALKIYYVLLLEGPQPKKALVRTLAEAKSDPKRTWNELSAFLSTGKQVSVMGSEITRAQALLDQKARSFVLQVADFLPVRVLPKQEAFPVLKRILNFAPSKLEHARLKHDSFLDYHRDSLAAKAKAGFAMYALPEDAARLRPAMRDPEIMQAIFSL